MSARRGLPTGVTRKHRRTCPARMDRSVRCRGGCGYQVQAGHRSARQTATFATIEEAVAWKMEVDRELAKLGRGRGAAVPTVAVAVEAFLAAARDGKAVTRSGTPYRPTTLAGYSRELRARIVPRLGERRLNQVTRGDVQAVIGELQTQGSPATTVRNVIVPLRALYRYAADHAWVTENPTKAIPIPGVSKRRRRTFADRTQAAALLAALDDGDRALWATAFYAGLRRGELMALRWSDVDVERRVLSVSRSYDRKVGVTHVTKTASGEREVPIPGALLSVLIEHQARAVGELVFARGSLAGSCRPGRDAAPFTDSALYVRSTAAWRQAELQAVSLHAARHSYGSMLLATGTPMPVVSELMGHSTIAVTVDVYGHTSDETKHRAAAALDEHLAAPLRPS
jgi:integrase